MTTSLVIVHSRVGLELALAALGRSGASGDVVLASYVDALIPELAPPLDLTAFADRFVAVVDLNRELAPLHPLGWHPARTELPLLRRLLATAWTGGPVDELWVEDLDDAPAAALAQVFDTAVIHLATPGLRAYGPPAARRPRHVQQRVADTWYRPTVPGLVPVGTVPACPVPAAAPGTGTAHGPALVLGADLSGSGLLAPEAETGFHTDLLLAAGPGPLALLPHPSMTPAQRWLVERAARSAGVALEVVCGSSPDDLVARLDPRVVIGCAQSALLRLHFAGRPVRSVGTGTLLAATSPYHHRERIALTIVDAVLGPMEGFRDCGQLQSLVGAVSHVMRPDALPELREATAAFLAGLDPRVWRRWFRRHRAERLGLPAPD